MLGTTEEQWRSAFESVFLAALRVSGAVVRHGTASDLCIAWVLSTSAKTPVPGLATSNGLRPGLAMLVKQLADELGPQGTRVIGLMPGAIETERATTSTRSRMILKRHGPARRQQFRCADMADPKSSGGLRPSCSPRLRPISPAQ